MLKTQKKEPFRVPFTGKTNAYLLLRQSYQNLHQARVEQSAGVA
jgi:hypothetical protein